DRAPLEAVVVLGKAYEAGMMPDRVFDAYDAALAKPPDDADLSLVISLRVARSLLFAQRKYRDKLRERFPGYRKLIAEADETVQLAKNPGLFVERFVDALGTAGILRYVATLAGPEATETPSYRSESVANLTEAVGLGVWTAYSDQWTKYLVDQ